MSYSVRSTNNLNTTPTAADQAYAKEYYSHPGDPPPLWSSTYMGDFLKYNKPTFNMNDFVTREDQATNDIRNIQNIADAGPPTNISRYGQAFLGQETQDTNTLRNQIQLAQQSAAKTGVQNMGLYGGSTRGSERRVGSVNSSNAARTLQDINRESQMRRMGIIGSDFQQQQQYQQTAQETLPQYQGQQTGIWANMMLQQQKMEDEAREFSLKFGIDRWLADQETWARAKEAGFGTSTIQG